jgi:hypothetical protein
MTDKQLIHRSLDSAVLPLARRHNSGVRWPEIPFQFKILNLRFLQQVILPFN